MTRQNFSASHNLMSASELTAALFAALAGQQVFTQIPLIRTGIPSQPLFMLQIQYRFPGSLS